MNVIDRVKIGVFDMPCESCTPHAKVQVRRDDAWDLAIGRRETRQKVAELGYVPRLCPVIEEGAYAAKYQRKKLVSSSAIDLPAMSAPYMGASPNVRVRQYRLSISRMSSTV